MRKRGTAIRGATRKATRGRVRGPGEGGRELRVRAIFGFGCIGPGARDEAAGARRARPFRDLPALGPGVTLVHGPSGSGKTTLFRGLHWGLFEETVERFREKDGIIRKGQKSCLVEIDIEGGYTVRRWRTRAARGVALLKDGERLKMPEEQIEKAIQALIGMDATLWRNTIYYAQGERRRGPPAAAGP